MRFLYQGKVYASDQPITINEVNYVPGQLTVAERTALGITEVIEQPMPDTRYNFVNEDPANPGAWIATPFTADQLKARLLAYAAEVRYGYENRRVTTTIGTETGVPISPARGDDRTALHITFSAITNALRADTDTFKFADGKSRVASNADMGAGIKKALAAVQAAFDKETDVQNQINAGTITTYDAVLAAFVAALGQ